MPTASKKLGAEGEKEGPRLRQGHGKRRRTTKRNSKGTLNFIWIHEFAEAGVKQKMSALFKIICADVEKSVCVVCFAKKRC